VLSQGEENEVVRSRRKLGSSKLFYYLVYIGVYTSGALPVTLL